MRGISEKGLENIKQGCAKEGFVDLLMKGGTVAGVNVKSTKAWTNLAITCSR
jgi:hypothetical protein